jgi:hypothetical protein
LSIVINELVDHPMTDMGRRLDGRGPRFGFASPVPSGPGWHSLSEAAADGRLTDWLDECPAAQAGMRNVAAAGTSLKLANCVLRPLLATLHLEHRVPDITAADVFVQRRPDGHFGRLGLRPVPLLAGRAELVSALAERIHGVFSPVLHWIRFEGRYGLRGLWGGVLDMIGAASLVVARQTGLPQGQVWSTTEQLLDDVARRASLRTSRPRPFSVRYSGGEAMFTVKGTCCLRYREYGLRAGQCADNESAYCHTCPFADEGLRRRHYAEQMERA